MSWLFAKIYDPVMRASEETCLAKWRDEVLDSLRGRVLEIGAGTGRNIEHYPARVERVLLAEPDPHMRAILKTRTEQRVGFEVLDHSAETLPHADRSLDAVVSTLVLCSVRDPMRALSEIRRVLVPGGVFAFIEHVAAGDGSNRLLWQKRVDPIWQRMAGNCHLTRRTDEFIRAAGFELQWLERASIRKAMPLARPSIRGLAFRPE